ncbi:MAG: hypothetical protein WDN45_07355 [Caulobacteraceae bacterium]
MIIGLSVALTQFVGMDGLGSLMVTGYHLSWIVVALVAAVAASAAGLAISELGPAAIRRATASVVLAAGMLICHLASLMAFDLTPSHAVVEDGIAPFALAVTVAGGVVFVLFLASVAALFDRRFEGMAAIEAERNAAQLRSILEQTRSRWRPRCWPGPGLRASPGRGRHLRCRRPPPARPGPGAKAAMAAPAVDSRRSPMAARRLMARPPS